MRFPRALLPAFSLGAFLLLHAACPAHAQQYKFTNLHTFPQWNDISSSSSDASNPESTMVQASDGTLYGVTFFGGANGAGAIYSYKSGVETLLYSFDQTDSNGKNTYGASPSTPLVIASDGSLYGGTEFGGADGGGTIYHVTNGQISLVYTFPSGSGTPHLTMGTGDVLYGAIETGGAHAGGQLFKVQSGVYTNLYDFQDPNGQGGAPNGANPSAAPTMAADGAFYGTTKVGGAYSNSAGTIYKFANGTLTTLYSFGRQDSHNNIVDGSFPDSKLVLTADGTLYGTTEWGTGSTTYGTLYALRDGVFTVLHNFIDKPDGNTPNCDLAMGPDGTLYGTTQFGGANGNGEVYSYKSGVFRNLYSSDTFSNPSNEININGGNPVGVTVGSDGALYVDASVGGVNGNGTLFSLSSSSWTVRSIAAAANGETRLLWTQPSGAASTWTISHTGSVAFGKTYGPFAGWTARKIAVDGNGMTDIWWTDSTGGTSYWQITAAGAVWRGPAFDPDPIWTATDFSAWSDGTVRILWRNINGATSFWTFGPNHALVVGPNYNAIAGWSAEHIAAGPSGSTRILWTTAQGAASVWTVTASGAVSYSPTFGPYTGWTCVGIGIASDGKTRLQWNNGASTSYWTVPSSGPNTYSQIWGQYDPWNPGDFSVGADGSVRLLWSTPAGLESYWTISPRGPITYSPKYGPY